MSSLELVVAVGLAVLVVTALARRVHVPPPALLLVAGSRWGWCPRCARPTCLPKPCCCCSCRSSCTGRASPRRGARSQRRPGGRAAEQHALLTLVAPLSAYLLAESVEAAGVLAAVVSGLWVSRASPRLFAPAARRHVRTTMSFISSLLNAALFVLVGLEAVSAVENLGGAGLAHGLVVAAAVSAAVIGARFVRLFTSPYLIRALDRRPQQRRLRLGARPRAVMAAAGFRGAGRQRPAAGPGRVRPRAGLGGEAPRHHLTRL